MSNEKIAKSKQENPRSRWFTLMLYPENKEHKEAVEKLSEIGVRYAYILHDRDKWSKLDEEEDPAKKAGEHKKEHWHIVVNTGTNARYKNSIAKALGIENRFIQSVANKDGALLYLTHENEATTEKHIYSDSLIIDGGLKEEFLKAKKSKNKETEETRVVKLIEALESFITPITVTQFVRHCALNGMYAECRRLGNLMLRMIDEHNERCSYTIEEENEPEPIQEDTEPESLDEEKESKLYLDYQERIENDKIKRNAYDGKLVPQENKKMLDKNNCP